MNSQPSNTPWTDFASSMDMDEFTGWLLDWSHWILPALAILFVLAVLI